MIGEALRRDLRLACRQFSRTPSFVIVVALTLGLGLGATTAMFSVVDTLVFRPLPFPEADRLILIWAHEERQRLDFFASLPDYEDWQGRATSFATLGAYRPANYAFTGGSTPERVPAVLVTPSLLGLIGATTARGRLITAADTTPGARPVALLSDRFWARQFGRDPAVVGRTIRVEDRPATVIGILPSGSVGPSGAPADLWLPLAFDPTIDSTDRSQRRILVYGRLRADRSVASAQAEMDVIADALARSYPDANAEWGIRVEPLVERLAQYQRPRQFSLFGAALLVLLIACVNVGGLFLARGQQRARELAVRMALGATRRRLVRQLALEAGVLAALGGGVGFLIAAAAVRGVRTLAPPSMVLYQRIDLDPRALVVGAALTIVVALLCGVWPAWRVTGGRPVDSLRGPPGAPAGGGGRWFDALAIVEVSLSVVLVVAAGLLTREFVARQPTDLGFDPDNRLTVRLSLRESRYRDAADRRAFVAAVDERLRAVPGVRDVGASTIVPFDGYGHPVFVTPPGVRPPQSERPDIGYRAVTPTFARTLGLPLLAGRSFTDRDVGGEAVAIIDETLQRRLFGAGSTAVGQTVRMTSSFTTGGSPESDVLTIVGVVGGIATETTDGRPRPRIYVPFAQRPATEVTFVVATDGDPRRLADSVRDAMWDVDPDQPLDRVATQRALIASRFGTARFAATVMGQFATVALVLAAVGLYGVLTLTVARRRFEFGMRMALGATARDVVALMSRTAARLLGCGLTAGLLAAWLVTRVLSSLLSRVSPTDQVSFALTGLILVAVGTLACLAPARRAIQVAPLEVIRAE